MALQTCNWGYVTPISGVTTLFISGFGADIVGGFWDRFSRPFKASDIVCYQIGQQVLAEPMSL